MAGSVGRLGDPDKKPHLLPGRGENTSAVRFTEPDLFCLLHSMPTTEMMSFALQKGFIHEAAK